MARRLRAMPQALSDELESLAGEPAPAEPREEAPGAGAFPVAFRDRHYRMRTITGPGGRAIRVRHQLALAEDAETIAWLDQHPDFERND